VLVLVLVLVLLVMQVICLVVLKKVRLIVEIPSVLLRKEEEEAPSPSSWEDYIDCSSILSLLDTLDH
jgi:hypothetical protein